MAKMTRPLEPGLDRLVEIGKTKDSLQVLKEGKLRGAARNLEHLLARGDTNVKITLEEQLGPDPGVGVGGL